MIKLYENIKTLRKANGWSQDDLAKRMGYTDRSSIAKIEAGTIDLSESKIMAFAKLFGVKPCDLMGLDDLDEIPTAYTPLENEIITRFRQADTFDQTAVLRILKLEKNADASDSVEGTG